MSDSDWHYLPTGQRSHTIRADQLAAYPDQTALCGTSILAFLPPQTRWQNDHEGLAAREHCATCLRLLAAEQVRLAKESGENNDLY